MKFPARVVVGLLALTLSAAVADAASTQRKKTQAPAPFPPTPQQDQSYLYLSPNGGPRDRSNNYVTNGTGIRDQPFYGTMADPGAIPLWSNR